MAGAAAVGTARALPKRLGAAQARRSEVGSTSGLSEANDWVDGHDHSHVMTVTILQQSTSSGPSGRAEPLPQLPGKAVEHPDDG
jgi:uncharacterized protein YhjY with autotransporter beta-barrel domain